MPLESAPYKNLVRNGVPYGETLAFEVPRYGGEHGIFWKPNTPFEAVMRVTGSGGSVFTLVDEETRINYQMFISDMTDAIQIGAVYEGCVRGRFHVIKRNVKYGLKLL